MSNNTNNKWSTDQIDTLRLNLDDLNPRIDATKGSNQATLRTLLLETEEVVELAEQIISAKGIMAGERIIVTHENNKPIVLEGNRRVTACQLLLDQKLVPESYKNIFPKLEDATIRNRLLKLQADIAPTRAAAEPIITRRHTAPGIKKWSVEAKIRRLNRFIEDGLSVEELMALADLPRGTILKSLREHKIIDRIKNLPGWNASERKQINSPKTKWNPLLRFFTLKGSRAPFKIGFGADGAIHSALSKEQEDRALELMFKPFLVPTDSKGPKFTTRTSPHDVYAHVARADGDLKKFISQSQPTTKTHTKPASISKGGGRLTAKTDKFFESLVCTIKDDRLQRLAQEISTIKYDKYPIAATFLQRALVESTLTYAIKQAKLYSDLTADYNSNRPNKKDWRDPGLDAIISFVMKHHDKIFVTNVKRALDQWKGLAKDWSDLVIHGNYVAPSIHKLEHSATLLRPIIFSILTGDLLVDNA